MEKEQTEHATTTEYALDVTAEQDEEIAVTQQAQPVSVQEHVQQCTGQGRRPSQLRPECHLQQQRLSGCPLPCRHREQHDECRQRPRGLGRAVNHGTLQLHRHPDEKQRQLRKLQPTAAFIAYSTVAFASVQSSSRSMGCEDTAFDGPAPLSSASGNPGDRKHLRVLSAVMLVPRAAAPVHSRPAPAPVPAHFRARAWHRPALRGTQADGRTG
jgi:hypothetical protein